MSSGTKLKWLGNMAFDVELNNHHFTIDADARVGGKDQGPRPKPLLLSALAGCTGMDVVSILKKMKVEDYQLELTADGDSTEEHPKYYHTIYLDYKFTGEDLPLDKIRKAVKLSEERYCGVSEMLRQAAKINTRILVNGKEI